jgi:hypothetical protein
MKRALKIIAFIAACSCISIIVCFLVFSYRDAHDLYSPSMKAQMLTALGAGVGGAPLFASEINVGFPGKRYVLIYWRIDEVVTAYAVFDTKDKVITSFTGGGVGVYKPDADTLLFIEEKRIYLYQQDTAEIVDLEGSRLEGEYETYESVNDEFPQSLTYLMDYGTDENPSAKIAVFDSSSDKPGERYRPLIRYVTLQIP